MGKKAILHTSTLINSKATKVLRDLFRALTNYLHNNYTNQGNGSEMTFAARVTKINLINLKI